MENMYSTFGLKGQNFVKLVLVAPLGRVAGLDPDLILSVWIQIRHFPGVLLLLLTGQNAGDNRSPTEGCVKIDSKSLRCSPVVSSRPRQFYACVCDVIYSNISWSTRCTCNGQFLAMSFVSHRRTHVQSLTSQETAGQHIDLFSFSWIKHALFQLDSLQFEE